MGARVAGVLPGEWSWTHGLMLGAILAGSSSIIIMPAISQARIDAKIANPVSLQSALTDAFCVGTTAVVDPILRGGGAAHSAGWMLARSFGIALVAAGVLATLPASAGVPGTQTLPIAVFACVFTTILAFAVGFPLARRGVAAGVAEAPAVALPAGAARPELAGTVAGEVIPGGGAATIGNERDKSY